MAKEIISEITINKRILTIRGNKVMLDSDLAGLYGVDTKVLNQAVKRNKKRFPEDFMFKLNKKEKDKVVTNCDHIRKLKFSSKLPYALTEQGIAILSSVLKSEKAIFINIQIMKTFIKIKKMVLSYKELQYLIQKIETELKKNKNQIKENKNNIKIITNLIQQLLEPPKPKKTKIKMSFIGKN